MSILLDSSELREAARLIGVLSRPAAPSPPSPPPVQTYSAVSPLPAAPQAPPPPEAAPAAIPVASPSGDEAIIETSDFRFRGEQLEHALKTMCRRGGLTGAVLADRRGFALAVYNSPVDDDAVAAFTTVLGDALEKAATLLGEHGAENISMDINYTDKVVLRRFHVDRHPYFIMVLCPQHVDERSEVEVSIDQISRIMST